MLSLNKYIRLNEGTVGTLNADAGINNMIDANDMSMAILCILVYGLIRQGFKQATLKKIGAEFFRISHGILADGTDILKKVIDDKIKKQYAPKINKLKSQLRKLEREMQKQLLEMPKLEKNSWALRNVNNE